MTGNKLQEIRIAKRGITTTSPTPPWCGCGGHRRLGRRHSGGVKRLSTERHPRGVELPQPDNGVALVDPPPTARHDGGSGWKSRHCCGGRDSGVTQLQKTYAMVHVHEGGLMTKDLRLSLHRHEGGQFYSGTGTTHEAQSYILANVIHSINTNMSCPYQLGFHLDDGCLPFNVRQPIEAEVDINKKTENRAKMTKLSMEWKRL
ncbi:hypothetical protein Tco_0760703 [Tanacetum coccineum]